jgi:hypothetical protein
MKRVRFTVASLLGLVLFAAVGTAALRAATDLWDSIVFSATVLVLLAAVLLAVHRTERKRAYWLGFALVGWVYLGVSLVPPVASRLLTTAALGAVGEKLRQTVGNGMAFGDFDSDGHMDIFVANTNGTITTLYQNKGNGTFVDVTAGSGLNAAKSFQTALAIAPGGSPENFVRIGHSLFALVLAFLGGHLSRYLGAHARPRDRALL